MLNLLDTRIKELEEKIKNFKPDASQYIDEFNVFINVLHPRFKISIGPFDEEIKLSEILSANRFDEYVKWFSSWVKEHKSNELDPDYQKLIGKLEELKEQRDKKEKCLKQPLGVPRWRSNVLPKESDANENGDVYYWNGLKKCIQLCKWSDIDGEEPWMSTSDLPNPR